MIFLAAFFALAVLWCIHTPRPTERSMRRMLLASGLLAIGLEIYKQVVFSFGYENGTITFDYMWYSFPFQFCSTPMYVCLLAALVPCRKLHQSLCAYLATFSLFAGLAVMFYPTTVFTELLGINIQTMVCHGLMVSMGIHLLFSDYVSMSPRTLSRALPVFMVLITAAMVMNEAAYRFGLLETDTFNMFFISPYCAPSLPVYSLVQQAVPFPLSVTIYILGFTLAAGLVLGLAALLKMRLRRRLAV